jgi:WD40 repeat protein
VSAPLLGVYLVPARGGHPRLVLPYPAPNMALGRLAFDQAGQRLAVASHYGPEAKHLRIYLVELATGAVRSVALRERDGQDPWAGGVRMVAFTADRRVVYAGDGGIHRWDPASGVTELLAGGPGTYATLVTDRAGRRVIASIGRSFEDLVRISDSHLLVLDLDSGRRRVIESHGDKLTLALATDPAGETVVTGDVAGVVRVGRVSGGEPHLLLGHTGAVSRVTISPDGRWIASASGSEIRLWPMPDLSRPALHTLPYEALMGRLRALTNLEVVEDRAAATGYSLKVGPFPGWQAAPEW